MQIEIEGEWQTFTWEELNETILFGNNLSSYRKRLWSGLTDKNGKEIYEGDIILVNGLNGFIKYLGCSFMIEWIGTDVYSDLLGWDNYKTGKISEGTDYEIIGNIYENSELLNPTV